MRVRLVNLNAPTKQDQRRVRLRDERWERADKLVWSRQVEDGFVTIPRTLPLIATLIKRLSEKGADGSRVYLDLWGRVFDQGLVEVNDEKEFALCAGVADNTRTIRAWQERMRELEELGFIITAPSASRKYGFVLLLHPHAVVHLIHQDNPHRIPGWWLDLYRDRVDKIGAKMPDMAEFAQIVSKARARKAS